MKKWLKWIIPFLLLLGGMIYTLNIKVTTRQGINYQWHTIEIPLYLKILDFFDRHCNYRWTAKRIIGDPKSKIGGERALNILKWTHENIKRTPEGYPVIDDHVWHIIVRGYGEDDQFSDVFTTLCNYAGIEAFFSWVHTEDRASRIPLSFVKADGIWTVFDPYNGVYFKNREGGLASIEDVIKGDWLAIGGLSHLSQIKEVEIDYTIYLKNLSPIKETMLARANTQSPLNRLRYEIKKWLK